MKQKLVIFTYTALAVSALLFALSVYRYSDWNWRPVEEPFPGPGLEVAAAFKINSAGNYRVEVLVPVKINKAEVSMAEQPPIPCDVILSIEGPAGFHTEQEITQLRHVARYYFGKTDTYVAESLELSATGEYKMRLSNKGAHGLLGDRGAMFQFTQFEHPTESFLESELVRGAGWLFLAVGCISGIASLQRNEKRTKAQQST